MTEEKAANLYVKAMKEAHAGLDFARSAIIRASSTKFKPETVNCLAMAVTHLDGADIAVNEAMRLAMVSTERFLTKVLMSQIGNVRDLINDRTKLL